MRTLAIRAALACALLLPACPLLTVASSGALAETAATPAPSASPDSAEQPLAQRPLTDTQIQNYVAAQKQITAIINKLPEDKREQPDAQTQAAIDKIPTKLGFKDYDDFSEVGSNIEFILQGFDPAKKTFVGHEAAIKSQIAEVNADKSINAKDKAEALGQLNESLKHLEPVKYPDNIKVVTKHYAELSELFGG